MREWIIERGIGETRAALVDNGAIVEARIDLDGATPAGTVLAARLVDGGQAGRNAVARDEEGTEYLLPDAPRAVTQGAALNIEVAREAIPGSEPWKRPLARASDLAPAPAAPLQGRSIAFPVSSRDELGEAGWYDVIEQARSGLAGFPGGTLRISLTPAMTLVDVDGLLPPGELAVAGAAAAAQAIRRLGIGGSIGIDLPTVAGKAARQAAAAAIDAHLPPPFERTAVNGFGFVQIVRPRARASLLDLAADRAAFEARALLRRAGRETGMVRLAAHPAVAAVLQARPDWTALLARQVGGAVSLRADASIAMSGGHAEPC